MSDIDKAIIEKAKELDIEVKDDMDEDDLKDIITEKEKKIAEQKEKENDVEYWKEEAGKAFSSRDIAKGDKRTLQKKVKDLEDNLKDAPDKDKHEESVKQIKELTKFKKAIEEKEEEESLKSKSELEKAEVGFGKQLKALEQTMNEKLEKSSTDFKDLKGIVGDKDQVITNLRKSSLKSEIMEAASRFEAYNPAQIVNLIQDKFEYDESLDKFSNIIKDVKGKITDELTVEESVKAFLEDPSNDNLVKSGVNTDGLGLRQTEQGFVKKEDKDKKLPKGAVKYDPKDPDLILEAEEARLTVEEWVEVKEMKDKKMNKIRGIKTE